MKDSTRRRRLALLVVTLSVSVASLWSPAGARADAPTRPREIAVLAGGCFWGVEAVFERVKGVTDVVSGFAGGSRWTATYDVVSLGVTNHAESVQVTYDPSQVTFEQLLAVFFSVAHDPTQLNRQGPDVGRQYRSAVFYANEEQARTAAMYVARLESSGRFPRPIVTTIVPLEAFYPADGSHQNFLDRHPTYPYIVANDLPKLEHLARAFPDLVK